MSQLYGTARIATLIADRWIETHVLNSLQASGLHIEAPKNALGLLSLMARNPVDLVLVESRRNDLVDCMASLRFHGLAAIPVIAIGPSSVQHIIDALSQGACDYLGMNDGADMLAQRVLARVVLSRRPVERTALQLGDLVLDSETRALRYFADEVRLTSREFGLAWMLFERAGEVVNLQTLSCRVWGREASLAKRTIEQHISRLRQKLECAGAAVGALVRLQAIHNIGYRLTHTVQPGAHGHGDISVLLPAAA